MTLSQNNLTALPAFAVLAERFCTLIESLQNGAVPGLFHSLEELLAQIHIAILSVEMDSADDEHPEFEKMEMSHKEWGHIAETIRIATGKQSADLMAWHEELRDKEETGDDYCATRAWMLWDDLADIYRNLKNGLVLWKLASPPAKAEAAWTWRFNFESHWGEHLFRASMSVHEARYQFAAD